LWLWVPAFAGTTMRGVFRARRSNKKGRIIDPAFFASQCKKITPPSSGLPW
jgi:hypothetical protein